MGNCDITSIEICDIIYAPYVGLTYTILDKINHHEKVSASHLKFE